MKLTWDSCIIASTTLSSPTRHSTCHTRCSVCTTPAPILFTCHCIYGLVPAVRLEPTFAPVNHRLEKTGADGRYYVGSLFHDDIETFSRSGTLMTVSFIYYWPRLKSTVLQPTMYWRLSRL
ncbi:unnamed protein product, partial [Notodromas monacha]